MTETGPVSFDRKVWEQRVALLPKVEESKRLLAAVAKVANLTEDKILDLRSKMHQGRYWRGLTIHLLREVVDVPEIDAAAFFGYKSVQVLRDALREVQASFTTENGALGDILKIKLCYRAKNKSKS